MRAALVGRLRWGWLARVFGDGSLGWAMDGPLGLSLKTEEGQGCLEIQRVAWIEV